MVTFGQVGGAICLDFANTGSQRRQGPFKEGLPGYDDLVGWSLDTELLSEREADELRALAARQPARAAAVLERARSLREAIYRVFAARFRGEPIPGADLHLISDEYADATAHRVLTPTSEGEIDFEWRDGSALERPLWPVAVSAAVLASSDEVTRVKECATDNCNWLFLDASKNRSRRWCEMKECGNRAKARRHYHRHRKA